MRLSLTLLSSLALVGCMSAQVTFRAGGPPPECTVTASQDTICAGESVTLSTTTNMTGIPSSGSLTFVPGGGVTDIEGNTYTSALIGTQEWTTQNLRTATYSNGDPIPYLPVNFPTDYNSWQYCEIDGVPYSNCWTASDTSDWGRLWSDAYCYMNNDPATDQAAGKLYHGFAFIDPRGLCPQGWHVPDFASYTQLLEYLGIEGIGGSNDYSSLLLSGGNTSGFSAVLSGALFCESQVSGPLFFEPNIALFGTSNFYADSNDPSSYFPSYVYPQHTCGQLILVGSEPPIGGLPPSWLSYFFGLDAMSCRCVKDQEGTGELQYLWNTGATAAVISESPTQPTTYTVNITNGSESCTESIMISVSNIPEPIVIFNGSNLYTTETGIGYQWYLNGIAISGETSATLEPTQNGTYVVEVTNATGCIGASDPYVHLSTTVIDLKEFRTRFYPNPSTGQFTLEINNVGPVTLQVTDLSGRIVYSKQLRSSSRISHHMVDLSGLAKGTYSLQVRSKGGDETQVVVIE